MELQSFHYLHLQSGNKRIPYGKVVVNPAAASPYSFVRIAEHEMGHVCYWVRVEKISILNQINAMKLYKRDGDKILFWETWDIDDKSGAINQGTVGEVGQYRVIESGLSKGFRKVIQKEVDVFFDNGYQEVDIDDHYTLLIEYLVDGMGTPEDVEKQTRLEDRMNEFLGWNGLGHCDGGSIGSGTMEVCCYVIDFKTAKHAIAEDLAGTEFENYTRIYDENEE